MLVGQSGAQEHVATDLIYEENPFRLSLSEGSWGRLSLVGVVRRYRDEHVTFYRVKDGNGASLGSPDSLARRATKAFLSPRCRVDFEGASRALVAI